MSKAFRKYFLFNVDSNSEHLNEKSCQLLRINIIIPFWIRYTCDSEKTMNIDHVKLLFDDGDIWYTHTHTRIGALENC